VKVTVKFIRKGIHFLSTDWKPVISRMKRRMTPIFQKWAWIDQWGNGDYFKPIETSCHGTVKWGGLHPHRHCIKWFLGAVWLTERAGVGN
jgi:hypothetical protein